MYKEFNANPLHRRTGDCVIRALSKALNKDWNTIYIDLMVYGLSMGDWPSENGIWGRYLKDNGWTRHVIPDHHVGKYTVADFANDHQTGTYILALNGHVVCVMDGDYWDAWNSGDMEPIFYWTRN